MAENVLTRGLEYAPDFIAIDGGEGGSGAAPQALMDHMALPIAEALPRVIDALIESVMAAKDRAEMVTATRAIDRVLRASHYWVPHWYKASHHMVFWNRFSRPAVKPLYDRGVDTWWYDAEKAAKLKVN